jgi:D-alanyl-lipoteichoic acid acyltransferase DltB (MBOAT superfamily)
MILSGVILINYFTALLIEKSNRKERILVISIIANVALLFIYKYFNFFNSSITDVLQWWEIKNPVPLLHLLAPVGISYFSLQAIGYNIDVYSELQPAEKKLHVFAAFFLFFPKIAQGPVERPRNLIPQLHKTLEFNYARVTSGLKLIAWGLFKKLVIADRLSILVNQVYGHPHDYTGLPLLTAGLFYTFQLYADFSGYTDIAIGTADIMGLKLMKNFNRPFTATSVTDFWKRWHISFSTWLYEYVYNPLSLTWRKLKIWGMVLAIFITFLISGLWHGVGWVFVLWGMLNGIALAYEIFTQKWRRNFWKKFSPPISSFLCKAITFCFTTMSFTFARANSLSDAGYIFTHFFDSEKSVSLLDLGLEFSNFSVAIISIAVMEWMQHYQTKGSVREMISLTPVMIRWAIYCISILILLNFGEFGGGNFIYIQF